MAARDYILCGDCGVKLIYDGDDNAREWLEERYGDPSASTWTADIICPECLAKLRAEVETLRRERDKLLAALKTIKKTVCGERIPNWESDWNTTHTRGIIADVCDIAIAKVKPLNALSETSEKLGGY